MEQQVIDFAPPAEGFSGAFYWNTFRLGRVWNDRVKEGDEVLLMMSKKLIVFGRAVISDVYVGKLRQLAETHAVFNHNQRDNPDTAGAPDRLIANMTKRYGPHLINNNKLSTVIYMRMIE
jgi:hypothetical protein